MATKKTQPEVIETGVVALDLQMGGFLPQGKIIELNGESGSGKTSMALFICRSLVKQGKKSLYIDIERGITDGILNNMGILKDTGKLSDGKLLEVEQDASLFSQVQGLIDDALGKDPKDRTKIPVRHQNTPDFIVLDSLAMLMPDTAKEKNIDSNVANNMIASRYTTQFFKDLVGDLAATGTTLLFINHLQTKMKKFGFSGQIAYQDSAGSGMVKYGPDIRFYIGDVKELKRARKVITGIQESKYGSEATITTKKSRVDANGVKLPIMIVDGFGVANGYTLKPICENLGWITSKPGGNYYINEPLVKEQTLIKGLENCKSWCQNNAGLIVKTLREKDLYKLTFDSFDLGSVFNVKGIADEG